MYMVRIKRRWGNGSTTRHDGIQNLRTKTNPPEHALMKTQVALLNT
jgi:hypothetical protein